MLSFQQLLGKLSLITLCFILVGDLQINILKFVSGHGTVVEPTCTNIIFGYKQAQQYSREQHINWVLSVLSVAVYNMLNCIGRTCKSLL